MRFKAKPMLTT